MVAIDYSKLPKRDVMCIDCKSFFASVESVRRGLHPLESLLVVMSRGDSDGGLVLAASPRAKAEYDIKTGTRKFELKPDWPLVIVEPQMADYIKMNLRVNAIFKRFTDDANWFPYSIDESFIDVTASHRLFGTTETIAHAIQTAVYQELGLVVCVGMGDNPLLAKLALDNEAKEKSPYRAYWGYQHVGNIRRIQPLTAMWGIGTRTAKTLKQMGIFTIASLVEADVRQLRKKLGIMGEQLYYHAHGIDYSILSERVAPIDKSYGTSQILMRDYNRAAEIQIVIREMVGKVAARLRSHHVTSSVMQLSISYSKHSDVVGFHVQQTMAATNRTKLLKEVALSLFKQHYQQGPVRRIAVTCGKVSRAQVAQLDLFEPVNDLLKDTSLEKTIDSIQVKYGYQALMHASSLAEGATALKRSRFVGGH